MPTGQSWEIRHLPWQISVNEVRREPGRDGTRKWQIIHAILELISSPWPFGLEPAYQPQDLGSCANVTSRSPNPCTV